MELKCRCGKHIGEVIKRLSHYVAKCNCCGTSYIIKEMAYDEHESDKQTVLHPVDWLGSELCGY